MSEANKDICEMHIIDRRCREQFVPLLDNGPLEQTGVTLAGISRLEGKYCIGRVPSSFTLILATTKGEGQLTLYSGIQTLKENDILIAPKHSIYKYELGKSKRWDIVWFHLFDSGKQHETSLNTDVKVIRTKYTLLLKEETQQLMHEISDNKYLADEARRAKESYLSVLLKRLLAGRRNPVISESEKIVRQVWQKIECNLNADWSLERIAKLSGYSAGHFNRLCKQYFSCSAMRYLTDMRMRYGYYLLGSSRLQLKSIAELCGYNNEFAFSVAFKRKFGYSPSHVRLQIARSL